MVQRLLRVEIKFPRELEIFFFFYIKIWKFMAGGS